MDFKQGINYDQAIQVLLYYWTLICAALLPAPFRGDLVCPGGRRGREGCSRLFPGTCSPSFYCYDPFIDRLGSGVCCPRRFCPDFPDILCLRPNQRCFVDRECPFGWTCCNTPCGRRCAPPP